MEFDTADKGMRVVLKSDPNPERAFGTVQELSETGPQGAFARVAFGAAAPAAVPLVLLRPAHPLRTMEDCRGCRHGDHDRTGFVVCRTRVYAINGPIDVRSVRFFIGPDEGTRRAASAFYREEMVMHGRQIRALTTPDSAVVIQDLYGPDFHRCTPYPAKLKD